MDAADEIEHALLKLPPRDARLVCEVYLHGRTQAEAAKIVGISQGRASVILAESLRKMRA